MNMHTLTALLGTYYGIDWLGMFAGFFGMYLLTSKRRLGFAISIFGFGCGLIVSYMAHQYAFVLANLINIYFASLGYIRWGEHPVKVRRQLKFRRS
jgi:hypothetical protein